MDGDKGHNVMIISHCREAPRSARGRSHPNLLEILLQNSAKKVRIYFYLVFHREKVLTSKRPKGALDASCWNNWDRVLCPRKDPY